MEVLDLNYLDKNHYIRSKLHSNEIYNRLSLS